MITNLEFSTDSKGIYGSKANSILLIRGFLHFLDANHTTKTLFILNNCVVGHHNVASNFLDGHLTLDRVLVALVINTRLPT